MSEPLGILLFFSLAIMVGIAGFLNGQAYEMKKRIDVLNEHIEFLRKLAVNNPTPGKEGEDV